MTASAGEGCFLASSADKLSIGLPPKLPSLFNTACIWALGFARAVDCAVSEAHEMTVADRRVARFLTVVGGLNFISRSFGWEVHGPEHVIIE